MHFSPTITSQLQTWQQSQVEQDTIEASCLSIGYLHDKPAA